MFKANRKPESLVLALKRLGCAIGDVIEPTQRPKHRDLVTPVNHGARQTL